MARFLLRDASDPEYLPHVEASVIYNDVADEVEIFLDEPHGEGRDDVQSPNLRMSTTEARALRDALTAALQEG